jgi:PAS domain S-box-containing protein
VLSLSISQRVHSRYRLEGSDNEWEDGGARGEAPYNNLGPGKYTFQVVGSNNDGVWNDTGASLTFTIQPAFYQTAWFQCIYALAAGSVIWLFYRLRLRHLRDQERKLRDVVETIPAFVWTALPDGSIDSANNHWEEFSGLSAEKTAGSGWLQALHREDQNRHAQKWRASVSSGGNFENEVRFRRANGEYRWFLVRAVPMLGPHGKIVKWYGTATDIEDRKRAEEERERLRQLEDDLAQRQERKLRDVIETIPTFAWSALPDGFEDFVNHHWEEYSGLSAEKSAGAGWQAAVHPSDLKRHQDKWRASLATGEPFENEVRYRRAADGQYRWFLARAVPLRDAGG